MQIKGIKRGKMIELFEEINLPDDTEIIIDESNLIVADKAVFGIAIAKFCQETDLKEAEIEPEIFQGVRDLSPGRDVVW